MNLIARALAVLALVAVDRELSETKHDRCAPVDVIVTSQGPIYVYDNDVDPYWCPCMPSPVEP